ncbi:MAG TPA: hypothetical protein DCK95_08900 [Anaerolineaceae bacterium]|nr:hypothetical protein [Anaerolineaceae bacterium]
MKTIFTKKNILLIVFIVLAIVVIAILVIKTPSNNEEQFTRQTAVATVFAPTEHPPVVELQSAQADPKTLTIVLSLTGLELVEQPLDLDTVVCDPYIQTDEHVQFTSFYRESEFPEKIGDPIIITYQYGMDAGEFNELNIRLDLTIGPCGPDLQEMLVTPAPKINLVANYVLNFVVPIE